MKLIPESQMLDSYDEAQLYRVFSRNTYPISTRLNSDPAEASNQLKGRSWSEVLSIAGLPGQAETVDRMSVHTSNRSAD